MKPKITSIYFPLFLVFYEISTYLSNDMYLPAMPVMMKDLGLSTKEVQLTVSTWLLGSASLPLIVGVMCDRFGRRPILLWGGLIYILSSAMCALSTSVHGLLLGRFIQGAATPTMMVAGYATIHELYDQKEAIKLLALMSSITILAPALGPLLGSAILIVSSWRGIFWVIAVLASAAVCFLYYVMPETRLQAQRTPVHLGTLLRQYTSILANKKFILLISSLGFIFAGFIVWISAGSLLLMETFGYTAVGFGVVQAVIFAFYIFGNRLVKYLIEIMSVSRLIWLGLGIGLAGGMLLALFAVLFPSSLFAFIAALSFFSFGTALCFPPLNRQIIETSSEPMGVRVALFTVIWMLFAVLGSMTAGHFFNGSIVSIALPVACATGLAALLNLFAKAVK